MKKIFVNKQVLKEFIEFSISKRIALEILKSKIWIITTSIFILLFLGLNLSLSFIANTANVNRTVIQFSAIIVIMLYLTFFNIFSISKYFSKEAYNGIMNLEIRSGISRSRLFWERVLVNKLFSTGVITFFLMTFFVIYISSGKEFNKVVALNYTKGLSFTFIFDILLSFILLMLATNQSSALMGALGTIILIFFASVPLLAIFIEKQEIISDIGRRNYRLALANETNKLSQKFKQNSLIEQAISDMQILKSNQFEYFDEDGNKIDYQNLPPIVWVYSFDVNKYNYLQPPYKSFSEFEENYLYDLMSSGLGSEVEKLPLTGLAMLEDKVVTKKFYVKISEATKQTTLFELFSIMSSKINYTDQELAEMYSEKAIKNSIFYRSENYSKQEDSLRHKFQGKFEYRSIFKKLYKIANNQERQILNLIDTVAKNNYLVSNGELLSYDTQNNASEFLFNEMAASEYDWSWAKYLKITPGQRTIQKILFQILEITTYILPPPINHEKPSLSITEAIKQVRWQNLNPYNFLIKQLNYSSNSLNSLAFDYEPFSNNISRLPIQMYDVKGQDSSDIQKTGFDKFSGTGLNGRNYEEIISLGNSINISLVWFLEILVSGLFLLVGFSIFYKKIIR